MSGRSLLGTARRSPWLIWSVAVGVYLLAQFHRMSLGVAGPLAAERLQISAAQLGSFVMLQLGVYALMQVPTGLLVDRFGARRMLLGSALLTGSAQLLFAFVTNYPLALLARGLLGCGDAMAYVSVLRLVAGWFPSRRYPTMTVLTGVVGMAGQLASTVPLTLMLSDLGWVPTFAIAGGITLAYSLLLLRPGGPPPFHVPRPGPPSVAVDPPAGVDPTAGVDAAPVVRARRRGSGSDRKRRAPGPLRQTWLVPAQRLGLWVHLTLMAGSTAFAALWGFPYMTQGLGYSAEVASTLLLVMVFVSLVANLGVAPVLARRRNWRVGLAFLIALACLVCWVILIAWPGGRPPVWVVVTIVCVLALGPPSAAVGFMLARDYNPQHRVSTATGMVNTGGFIGAVVLVFAVGQILDLVEPDSEIKSLGAFRLAFIAMAVVTLAGVLQMLVWALRTRVAVLRAAASGEEVPVDIFPHRWDRIHPLDPELLAAERDARRGRERHLASSAGRVLEPPGSPGTPASPASPGTSGPPRDAG